MILILKQVDNGSNIQANNLKSILDKNHATLLDGSMLPALAKIEINDRNMATLKSNLGDKWAVFPEKKYSVPGTKRKVA